MAVELVFGRTHRLRDLSYVEGLALESALKTVAMGRTFAYLAADALLDDGVETRVLPVCRAYGVELHADEADRDLGEDGDVHKRTMQFIDYALAHDGWIALDANRELVEGRNFAELKARAS